MSRTVQTPLSLEHALLGLLHEQPSHAYAIYQEFTAPNGLGQVWHLKQSHCYALLVRLEEHGYLVGQLMPQGARPPRRILALTPAGRAAFSAWLAAPVAHGRELRLEFLAKLYFASRFGAPAATTLIARQRQACRDWLEGFDNRAARPQDAYNQLVLAFRRGQVEAMLDWLDTCSETLIGASQSRAPDCSKGRETRCDDGCL